MNLPLVLDIALGLIFIFLTLSLLASEIQELVTTALQWRAEHLKKSIEILLAGNPQEGSLPERFADDLYRSPLIKALNQEAKGPISRFFRQLSHAIGDGYRSITGVRNVFGEARSGPSYLPTETFAVALLQKLDIEALGLVLSRLTMSEFLAEKLALIDEVLESLRNSVGDDALLEQEFEGLKRNLNEIWVAFNQQRISLELAIDQATEQLSRFIDNTEAVLADHNHCQAIIRHRLPYLKQSIFLRKLEPTISEALEFIFNPAHQAALPNEVREFVTQIRERNPDLPQQLKRNLAALAKQAQLKASSLDEGVLQLQKEVEAWFDRSMERASGVYRRNAKGVAILIGFLLAIGANADTFHIVSRLSKDSILRDSITQAADQVVTRTVQSADVAGDDPLASSAADLETDLEAVRTAVDGALEGLLLPIGWGDFNREQQRSETFLGIPWLRQVLGWLVTGVALSMGANFWYDLLGRFVRVRNTGEMHNITADTVKK